MLPRKQQRNQVTVRLDRQRLAYGQSVALKPGLTLGADILMDRRRLIEGVFEPLYGIGRRGFGTEQTHG